jgi:hypothetical protein
VINVDLTGFFTLYVWAGLVIILALWVYYDHRDQQVYERERSTSLFHCLKCGRLYSAPHHERSVACPVCAFENSKLKF